MIILKIIVSRNIKPEIIEKFYIIILFEARIKCEIIS